MPDYKTMYFKLAAQVANAIDLLAEAQRAGEEAYMQDSECIAIDDAQNILHVPDKHIFGSK